ncbi:MAG TPA: hypothetical protein PLX15_04400 [Candidatus Woesearchaeota archaeon]|nr:hypothetical protein [Candidatus Woesearchaeota archaeon]
MKKLFIYGFKLDFMFSKIKEALSEKYTLNFYSGYNKIKYVGINNGSEKIYNLFLKLTVALVSTFVVATKIIIFRPDYLMLCSSKPSLIGPLIMLFKRTTKIIYFPYDVMCLNFDCYKQNPFYDRFWERYCYKHCKGIIFKGTEAEEVKKIFDISSKPIFKINLVSLRNCQDIKIKNGEDVKVCYVCSTLTPVGNPDYLDDMTIIRFFLDKEISLEVYTHQKYLKEFSSFFKHKNFKFNKFVDNKILIKELSKFDYGIHISYKLKTAKLSDKMFQTTMGNREYDYLEAGIPIIVSDDGGISHFVSKNNVGLTLSLTQLQSLDKKILKSKRNSFKENILAAREKYAFENQISEFNEFIKKL